ncbi:OmpH family outer membrane protein [Aliiroseovarius sp. YM-037]
MGLVKRVMLATGLTLLLGTQSVAQQQPQPGANGILTVEPERLYAESMFGQKIEAELDQARSALIAENQALDTSLSEEEASLAERRPTMPADEFRQLADAFDEKVQGIRETQENKSKELTQRRESSRQEFFSTVIPILAEITEARGAVAVLERRVVLLAADSIDITDQAIARIDAELGDGEGVEDPAPK